MSACLWTLVLEAAAIAIFISRAEDLLQLVTIDRERHLDPLIIILWTLPLLIDQIAIIILAWTVKYGHAMDADEVGHISIHLLSFKQLEGQVVLRLLCFALCFQVLEVDAPTAHIA